MRVFIFFTFGFLILSGFSYGQMSQRESPYTYLFKPTPKEVRSILKKGDKVISEEMLHTQIDSILTKDFQGDELPPGDYLKVKTVDRFFTITLIQNHQIIPFIHENSGDLAIELSDLKGNTISDAKVRINQTNISYKENTNQYLLRNTRKEGLLSIEYKGIKEYFSLQKTEKKYKRKFRIKRIHHYAPIKYFWYPVRAVVFSVRNGYPYGWLRSISNIFKKQDDLTGYVAFSQPQYKKGDSIKVKAFFTNKNGKSMNKPVVVKIKDNKKNEWVKLAELFPYRKGAYQYEFLIPDSLDISSSQRVRLYFSAGNSSTTGSFGYEQYELKETSYTISSNRKAYFIGEPKNIKLSAKDENGLNALGVRAQVTVRPTAVKEMYQDHLFVPNLLYTDTLDILSEGDTELHLPDSLFKKADYEVRVEANFIDADGRTVSKQLTISHQHDSVRLSITQVGDSVLIEAFKKGEPYETAGKLDMDFSEDIWITREVSLPHKIRINPYVTDYWIKADGSTNYESVEEWNDQVSCKGWITSDSVYLQISNPARIPLNYEVSKGEHLVEKGAGQSDFLSLNRKRKDQKTYFLNAYYIWAGETRTKTCRADFYEKNLNISVDHPAVITPGQQVTFQVKVKDAFGKPVKNADLTGIGYTSKFKGLSVDEVPYFGKSKKYQKTKHQFDLLNQKTVIKSQPLDWQTLRSSFGLDTIDYYKFIYPEDGLQEFAIPVKDGQTAEFSPYFSKNGEIYQAEIIYLDGYPIYYSGTQETILRYAFRTHEGNHHLKIRTKNKLIYFDSLNLRKGEKKVLNFSAEAASHKNVIITDMPDILTANEQRNLWKYLMKVNLPGNEKALVKQGGKSIYLNNQSRSPVNYLIGPLFSGNAFYEEPGQFKTNFEMEYGYSYLIRPGLVKMKSYQSNLLHYRLQQKLVNPSFNPLELSLTSKEIKADLDRSWLKSFKTYNSYFTEENKGEIKLLSDADDTLHLYQMTGKILISMDDPAFVSIHDYTNQDFLNLKEGKYQMIIPFSNSFYALSDTIEVMRNGINYINAMHFSILPDDDKLRQVKRHLKTYGNQNYKSSDTRDALKNEMNLSLQNKFTGNLKNTYQLSGRVISVEDDEGIPGVVVIVKGTSRGVISDIDGNYTVNVSGDDVLQFSFVGLVTQELPVRGITFLEIAMEEDVTSLQEVVVTGYGVSVKRNLSASISTVSAESLQGRVAGVQIAHNSGVPGSALSVRIRGLSSMDGEVPLYIIDGVAYTSLPEGMSEEDYVDVSVLKGGAATAIYGARAVNGVVIISTKKGKRTNALNGLSENDQSSGRLRNNFKDAALWEPTLTTNAEGIATFTATFPDDITQWDLHFIAAGVKKQTGQAKSKIKTFQVVNAKLIVPNFLLSGDEVVLRGKVSNYKTDSLQVISKFTVNHREAGGETSQVGAFKIDTLSHTVKLSYPDTLKVAYQIFYQDNKTDGEERKVPVLRPGVMESDGFFTEVMRDSVYRYAFKDTMNTTHVKIYQQPLEILLTDFQHVTRYFYNCNEQMASKLIAWYGWKKTAELLDKKAPDHKLAVKKLSNKLMQNRNEEGLWGWWGKGKTNLWISRHVLKALLLAGEDIPQLDKPVMLAKLRWLLTQSSASNQLYILEMLEMLGENELAFQPVINSINRETLTINQYLRLALVAKKVKADFSLDSLLEMGRKDPFGGLSWPGEKWHTENNAIVNSAIMHQVLSVDSSHEDLQRQLISYLMKRRKNNGWSNTYETITVLDRLLIHFKEQYTTEEPMILLTLNEQTTKVKDFPFEGEYQTSELQIQNKGGGQVFMTAYQNRWNPAPERIDSLIQVNSSLQAGVPIKLGENTKLKVEINTEFSLEYVMVSVPIPAGCSFAAKSQYLYGADHVEYLYDRVNIYYSYLPVGKRDITFELTPRFAGKYQLNPAKAELMYFPTYFGREQMKNVRIKQ